MNDYLSVRIFLSQLQQSIATEFYMRITVALPERHRPTCLLHHPRAEIFIGHKQKVFVLRRSVYDFNRVTTCDNHVTERFDVRATIDVSNRPEIWICFLKRGEFVS